MRRSFFPIAASVALFTVACGSREDASSDQNAPPETLAEDELIGARTLELRSAPMRESGRAVNAFVRYSTRTVTAPGDSEEILATVRGFCVARDDQRRDAIAKAILVKTCTSQPSGSVAPSTSKSIELHARPVGIARDAPYAGESSYCYIPTAQIAELRLKKRLTNGLVESCQYALALSFANIERGGTLGPDVYLVDPVRAGMPEPENHNFQLGFRE